MKSIRAALAAIATLLSLVVPPAVAYETHVAKKPPFFAETLESPEAQPVLGKLTFPTSSFSAEAQAAAASQPPGPSNRRAARPRRPLATTSNMCALPVAMSRPIRKVPSDGGVPAKLSVPLQSVPQPDETLSQIIFMDPCIFWSPIV